MAWFFATLLFENNSTNPEIDVNLDSIIVVFLFVKSLIAGIICSSGVFPVRSPKPLIVVCAPFAPEFTAANEFATAKL